MTLPILLCGYSLPHLMGYVPSLDNSRPNEWLTREQLLGYALSKGLAGVEISLESAVPSFNNTRIEGTSTTDWASLFKNRGALLVADYGVLTDFDLEANINALKQATAAGAKTMRCLFSHLLCGDRRSLSSLEWQAKWKAYVERLRQVLPVAESLDISVAVENHQDLTSSELLRLWEETGESSAYGVCLDTGNPLAVGEDPLEFTQGIAPLVRNVHLKDYRVYLAPNGYRLVRCACGNGAIPFQAIIEAVRNASPNATFAIEIAAQSTRTIPILEADWHLSYPLEQTRLLPAALRTVWDHALPQDVPYSSAYEQGLPSAAIAVEEWDCVERSIKYFSHLDFQN